MLGKYESDCRCMPFADGWLNVKRRMQEELQKYWNKDSVREEEAGRFYLLGQLYRVLRSIGCEVTDDVMHKWVLAAESKGEACLKDSEAYGLSAWKHLSRSQTLRHQPIATNCPVMELRRISDES